MIITTLTAPDKNLIIKVSREPFFTFIFMDLRDILLLLAFVFDITLAFLTIKANIKKETNISYGLTAIWVGLWSLGIAGFRMSQNSQIQLFWNREFIIVAALIASSFLHFSFIFSDQEKKLKGWQRFCIYFPNLIILWGVMVPGVLIQDIKIRSWGNESILGWGYIYYGIYFSFLWAWSAFNLIKKYIFSKGIFRAQLRYILIGTMFSMSFGAVFDLFLILFGDYRWIWLGPYASFTFVLFSTYAIIRYRLMDIRIIARKLFISVGIAGFVYAMYYLISWFYINFFGGIFTSKGYLAGIILAPIFVIIFSAFSKGLQIIANRYLFASLSNYQDTITELTEKLNYLNDLNQIISLIVDTIKQTMQLDRAGVLLIDETQKPTHYQIAKVIGFNEQNGISLVQDSFLTQHLQKTQKPMVRDELLLVARDAKTKKDQNGFKNLYGHMEHIEASLCLPLLSNNKLIGIIVLGAKISGDAYTKEDLELLSTLSYQAGIAIDNARLYKEVQDFNKTLKQKVDGQTKEIKAQSEDIEEKNKYLQELLNMKTDFLRVVNHQLNTPLAVMKGYFSMMEEGSYPQDKAMKSVKGGLERISSTVSDFWDAYELEGERMKMDPQKTDITEIVDRLIPEKQKLQLAQERSLKVSVKKPDFKIPIVWCDYKKTAHVISNLLDNAVYYTRKGSVTIFYEMVGKDYLKISVKDTGVGISEEGKKKLFQKFSRGQNATDLRPDGSGLGLFIAKKIVEGNNGEISCFSEGINKGSTFSFTLPIYKNQQTTKGQEKPVSREKKIVIFDQD